MKKIQSLLLVSLSSLLVMGCNKAQKTEDWYINHHEDLVEKYTDCFKSMDRVSSECVAAMKAYHKEKNKPDVRAAMISAKKQINGSRNTEEK